MATIDQTEVVSHDVAQKKLELRIRIDGVDRFVTAHNTTTTSSVEHDAVLAKVANDMKASIERRTSSATVVDLEAGVGDWAAMPEGDDKQRIAQQAMRRVVELAREGKRLQANGRTRPEAAQSYMSTRSLKSKVWDNLTGTHAEKAAYLALGGPGGGTEYGDLNAYMNDLGAHAADWAAIVTFMDEAPNPQKIKTEPTV